MVNKPFGTGKFNKQFTYTQLIAPGLSTAAKVSGMRLHTIQVTVANKDTNVVVELQGSIDGTNYFLVPVEDVDDTGIAVASFQATITADGTYLLYVKDIALENLKVSFVSEAGGTAATIDAKYYGLS